MPDHDFVFALDISDDRESGRILEQLCATVLGHVGYGAPMVAELTAALAAAVTPREAGQPRRCGVRFVARGGELLIEVARAGEPDWRATRPLPPS